MTFRASVVQCQRRVKRGGPIESLRHSMLLNIARVAMHKKDGKRNETTKESRHHGRDQSTYRPPKHEPEERLVFSVFGRGAIGLARTGRLANRCQQ